MRSERDRSLVALAGALVRSPLWNLPPPARCLWISMLSLADSDGRLVADGDISLAALAGIPVDSVPDALSALASAGVLSVRDGGHVQLVFEPMAQAEAVVGSEAVPISVEVWNDADAPARTPVRARAKDDTPYDGILETWARTCPHLPQARVMTPARRAALRSFWQRALREARRRGMAPDEWVAGLFQLVAASDFLSGRETRFRADLFWTIKPANAAKIIDGNYDNREPRSKA
ncbi:MAG: hypothetical protein D6692_08560 [Planctomycetota bacterium]|nr:MAG: hypothetical protein D6692_08560 [Planctomycetota bacterium]